MNKTIKIVLIVISIFITISGFTYWKMQKALNSKAPCAFCCPKILEQQTFYEDNLVIGFCTHQPLQPGHCLAVIKRHINTFAESTKEEMAAIFSLLKKINLVIQKIYGPSSYMILQKNGSEAGQTVHHVHFHYIPKKKVKNKTIAMLELSCSFIKNLFTKPISKEKIAQNVNLMKKGFKELTPKFHQL